MQTYLLDFGTTAGDAGRIRQQRDQRRVDAEGSGRVGALAGDGGQLLAVWCDVDGAVTKDKYLPVVFAVL